MPDEIGVFRLRDPRAVPPGWPPDVAPNQIIFAQHLNDIRDSVYAWPGDVDAQNHILRNVHLENVTGAMADPTTAPGDLIARDAIGPARLPVSLLAGQVLTADPAQPQRMKWATPIGAVASVFGRTGAVAAQPGDYTAAQVSGAVDYNAVYANPPWISSLAWAKITGTPATFPPAGHTHDAGDVISGRFGTARLGAGVADATVYLRGDGAWAAVAGGGAGAVASVFGRTGTVIAVPGDYTVDQVTGAAPDKTLQKGDLLVRDALALNRLPSGANGQVLTSDATQALGMAWKTFSGGSGMPDPTTTFGDLIVRGAVQPDRLALGANGLVLTADSAAPLGVKWAVAGANNLNDPTTTKGDLLVRDSAAVVRLPVGVNGQLLTADSAQASGVKWAPAAIPTSRTIATGTGLTGGGDLSADRTLSVVADSTVQQVRVSKAAALVGTRRELNFIQGSNITLTMADDDANNRVNVTITGGAGSQSPWLTDVDAADHRLYKVSNVAIGAAAVNAGTMLGATGGDIEIVDAATSRSFGFGVNTPGGRFADPVTAGSLARYGLSYLGDMGGSYSWNVALSGWGGLRFFTVDQERIRITPGGEVGIGTTGPFNRCTIAEASRPSTDAASGYGTLSISSQTGAQTDEVLLFGVHTGDYSWIQACKPGSANRNLSLNPLGGLVGIATPYPAALLHVSNPDTSLGVLFNGASKGVRFGFGVNGTTIDGVDYTGVGSFQPLFLNGSTVAIQSSTLVVTDSGYVGIGGLGANRLTVLCTSATPTAPVTNNQIRIGESTNNPAYGLFFGFINDGAAWKGSIQSTGGGSGVPLLLQPQGGPIGIGKTNPGAYAIDLAGDVNISGQYRINGTPIGTGGITSQNVHTSTSRAYGTTYQNVLGKPFMVTIGSQLNASGGLTVYSDASNPPNTVVGTAAAGSTAGAQTWGSVSFWVMPGNYYRAVAGGTVTWGSWIEWA